MTRYSLDPAEMAMKILFYIIIMIAGYILGSLSISILLSKTLLGRDVRKHGSGNAGATNMARVFGMHAGILTLAGDMLKAAAAMLIGYLLCGEVGMMLGGLACLLGHCFPVLHGFKGGKGVASGAMVALAIDWRVFLCVVVAFLIGALLTKKVSFGSLCGAIAIFISAAAFGVSSPRLILAAGAMLLVIARHRDNIVRLLNGSEPDFRPARPHGRSRKEGC